MRNVILTAAIAGLGGLLFGYDTGVIASALLFIEPDFGLSSFGSGLVVAAVPIGAVAGAAGAGRLSDRYGRRLLIIGSAVVFIVGALGSAAADSEAVLVVSRVVVGIAIGLASATAPVYISEVSPPAVRGRLVTFFQLSVTVGIVVAYGVGLAFEPSGDWRWMLGLGALPAVFLLIGMLRMPQSPRWLVMAGRGYEAKAVLARIREDDPELIDAELDEISDSIVEEPGGWRDLLAGAVRAALVVGVGLAILQQVSGINTVIYFAPTIVGYTGIDSSSAAILASVAVGVVNVGMTVVAIRLLDRAGRRPLLLWGSALMAIALSLLALVFILGAGGGAGSLVAIGSLMLYVGAFAVSLGPIFWLLNSEIYPLPVRSKAAAVGTMANWFFNFLVSLTFLLLIDALGRSGAFFFYAAICVLTFLFCLRLVPETKGKRLEEIQAVFEERAGARA
ncbi:MAG: MFS transporter [Actinomycetes bacterium]|nr:MAG: MFS transporter [Actinomycetes bacterium]